MNLVVHPQADQELASAVEWYESQQIGLGDEFEDEVLLAFDLIGTNPEAWVRWPELPQVRVFPMERFPYQIPYYVASAETVVVLAVAHSKRRPGYWQARTPSR